MKSGISRLDVKLGARMLVKYPGLTLVGGLGMAVAIAIGACAFAMFYSYLQPTVPLDEGARVVGVENYDVAVSDQERRSLHDFVAWRQELKSVRELGAFRRIGRNLVTADGQAEPVGVAEMSAAGFQVARVPPLMGRHLVPTDERPEAPPVVVIGHDIWRARFAGDPRIVGRTIQLGQSRYTVVGVMPKGFAFPINFGLWTPLKANPADFERRKGPAITIFGRLAPGASMGDAQAELTAIGLRTAAAHPETHAQLRPRVLRYTSMFMDGMNLWELHLAQLLVSMILVVIATNVAILVYARTATRLGEIAVRSALGASRRRVVVQLFVEALVLSGAAAVVGLGIAWLVLRKVDAAIVEQGSQIGGGGVPFWMDFGISFGTVVYVMGLAVLGAIIVGVVPALKATGRQLQSGLRQLGGGTGMRLGKTWNVLIVAQVAFAVAALPAAVSVAWKSVEYGFAQPGFAAEEFLSARLEMDREVPASADAERYERDFTTRYAALQAELVRRLRAEPGVSAVTLALEVPGQEPRARIEIEGVTLDEGAGREARYLRVDHEFFNTFDVPVLTGRAFHAGEMDTAATSVIVNRTFVRQFLGDGNVLGRRVRYDSTGGGSKPTEVAMGRWYEIVGVVADLPANAIDYDKVDGRMYHPMAPGQLNPLSVALRVRGADPATYTRRFRDVATSLDPTLHPEKILPLTEIYRQNQGEMHLTAWTLGAVGLSVLLLSSAGIYALMSFTVAQRRREIGIRAALGAHPRRILRNIFSRALGQLAMGVGLGLAAATLIDR
ncbi:MAG TPA: ABC transporter permease, partial [Longimicrobium sp.]